MPPKVVPPAKAGTKPGTASKFIILNNIKRRTSR